jgi:integrase
MKRGNNPFWWKARKCWYVKIDGIPKKLDPDPDKAQAKWHELMAGRRELGPNPTVRELIVEFLAWAKTHNAPATVVFYRGHLDSFSAACGHHRVSGLKTRHVNQWLDARYTKTKNGSTRNGAIRSVKRVFSWAVGEERIETMPLASLKAPAPTRRNVCLTPDQYESLMNAKNSRGGQLAAGSFREVALILHETGCRPKEARTVEAKHVVGDCWVFPPDENKTGQQTGEPRIVHLNETALAITQRLMQEHPTGPLFRNRRGRPWTRGALVQKCQRMTEKLGFKVTPYSFRHGFATTSIRRKVDPLSIRMLMGHTRDSRTLERYYAHLNDDDLKAALKQATD